MQSTLTQEEAQRLRDFVHQRIVSELKQGLAEVLMEPDDLPVGQKRHQRVSGGDS